MQSCVKLLALCCGLLVAEILFSAPPGNSSDLHPFQDIGNINDLFEYPPWSSWAVIHDGRRREPVTLIMDSCKLPARMLAGKIAIQSSGGETSLDCSFPLVEPLRTRSLAIAPSAAARGWSFEPFASPRFEVNPLLIDQTMRVAELCRADENIYAALAIYKLAAPRLTHKVLGIHYISSIFSRTGKFGFIEPFVKEEMKYAVRTAWTNKSKDRQQKIFAGKLECMYLSCLIEGYARQGRYVEAQEYERRFVSLDRSFPEQQYFKYLVELYQDLDLKAEAKKIKTEAVQYRLKKFGEKSEIDLPPKLGPIES